MATAEWDKVEEAFARLDRLRVLAPALVAMRKLVEMIKLDASFADVHPIVSHVSLVLSRGPSKRRVDVSWRENSDYAVSFVDPPLEFSEQQIVREDAVLRVLREYLDNLPRQ